MTLSEYTRLMQRARKSQLSATAERVAALEGLYTAAAYAIAALIQSYSEQDDSDQPLPLSVLQALLLAIHISLGHLRADTFALMDAGLLTLAQLAAEREIVTGEFAGAPTDGRLQASLSLTRTLSSGETVTSRFGGQARAAVEHVAARAYDDGMDLADRLADLDRDAREAVEGAITQGAADGLSAAEIGELVKDALAKEGPACPRYRAATIAQTEMTNAYRQAHTLSLTDADGTVKDYVLCVGWRLSSSHEVQCQCDDLAGDDPDGLGPGNYLPMNVPSAPHPRCLCSTVTLLVDYPDLQFPGKKPQAQ